MDYLTTDDAQKILKENLREIIENAGGFQITTDQMQELVRQVMAGYQEYAKANGYTDPDTFAEHLMEYLQTPEAKAIMDAWQQETFGDTVVNITSDQLTKLARELARRLFGICCGKWKGRSDEDGRAFSELSCHGRWKAASDERAFRSDRPESAGESAWCGDGKLHVKGNGSLYRSDFRCD